MLSKTIGILIACLVLRTDSYGAGNVPVYTLLSVDKNTVEVQADFSGLQRDNEERLIAFSSLPGKVSGAVLEYNGRFISLVRKAEGWSGRNYLKWYVIPVNKTSAIAAAEKCTIVYRCAEPIWRGVQLNDCNVQSDIIHVPVSVNRLTKTTAVNDAPLSLPYEHGLKLEISRSGIYELTTESLRDHGVPVEKVASRSYRLFERDREVPLHITNAHHGKLQNGDRILFYGEKLLNKEGGLEQYSETNIYWFTWGEGVGARVTVVSGARGSDATEYGSNKSLNAREYNDTIRFEYDNIMSWLGNVEDVPPAEITGDLNEGAVSVDDWYWGNIGVTKLTRFQIALVAPSARGVARMRVALMGLSSIDSISPDHRVAVFINGEPAGQNNTAQWDGQRQYIFVSDTFSTDILEHGENEVTFQTTSDFADRSALNWMEMQYQRGYRAVNNRVEFSNEYLFYGKTVEYAVDGFTDDQVDLWDITHNRMFVGTWSEKGSGETRGMRTIMFQDSIGSRSEYYLQTTDLRLVPDTMYLDTVGVAWDSLVGRVDYLAISVDSFRTELEPLLQQHERDGLSTAFVSIDKIYNSFSYGIRNPESIRLFLRYLFTATGDNDGPRYLLLGGDTTHDLDKKNRKRNIVPTHLSRMPGWGPGGDDGYFVSVKGDDLFPDCAVGRFPAQNRREMQHLVEKTTNYIREPDRGYWRDNLLLLGGGEREFTRFNDDAVRDVVDERMFIYRLDADPESNYYVDEFTAPGRIADLCNSGVFMVNFNGHGGGNIWSDNNFFGYNDLNRLHNGEWGGGGRLPAVFSFTCLTGFFESSEYRSLGEEFLRMQRNGAITFYGASAYTSRNGNIILNNMALDQLLSGNWERLGDCLRYCEMQMLVRYDVQYLNLVRQYNLLGDPALPWVLTPANIEISQSLTDSGKTLTVKGNCENVKTGQARIALVSGDELWDKAIVPVEKETFTHTITLKDGIESALGTVRAYTWNDSAELRGWQSFAVDTCTVDNVQLNPSRPHFDDSISVTCRIHAPEGDSVQQVHCLYTLSENVKDRPVSFSGKNMKPDEDGGYWSTDGTIALPFNGSVLQKLYVYFRVITSNRSLQSRQFIFPVVGRPDYMFAEKRAAVVWRDDSLRISVEVHNNGNAPAPPVTCAFRWGEPDHPAGTFAETKIQDTLLPGEFTNLTVTLEDTGGVLIYHAVINPGGTIPEIHLQNNYSSGKARVIIKDITDTKNTLITDSLRVSAVEKPEKYYRLFLIEDTVNTGQPLSTVSRWAGRNREGDAVQWQVVTRPTLNDKDSLEWEWKDGSGTMAVPFDSVYVKRLFMVYDSTAAQWRYADGTDYSRAKRLEPFAVRTRSTGVYAVADITDIAKPEAIISVYGKTLETPDYTAKDQPFTLLLSDPSGIIPESVALLLNGKRIDNTAHSVVPVSGDLRSMTLSIYPDAQHRVDSLTVRCSDFAGNAVDRTFAYLPGKDLSIQSFSCHPNPFTAHRRGDGTIQTIRFAFLLTDIAKKVTLSIFTVSGKKIRTWTLNERIGYQQIAWDGRDHDGYRIANGTYYAKLIVKNDRKKAHKIIRIAKLEGF